MFSKSAQYYDDIYGAADKGYYEEAAKIHTFIQKHKHTKGNTLLDVACGTGVHAGVLSKNYKVEGLDLDVNMLKVAKKKFPKIRFHQGNMMDFDLKREFDVVTCLFSSIGYVKTKSNLRKAIKNMNKHLLPGGVLIVEPWFTPDQFTGGKVFALFVDQPDLKVSRMSLGEVEEKLSILNFHYMVGTPKGVEYFIERHELGLFTQEEYLDAYRETGLEVAHDPEGLDGRGLYIGLKS